MDERVPHCSRVVRWGTDETLLRMVRREVHAGCVRIFTESASGVRALLCARDMESSLKTVEGGTPTIWVSRVIQVAVITAAVASSAGVVIAVMK